MIINQNKIEKTCPRLFYLFIFLLPWQTRWIFKEAAILGEPYEYGRMSFYGFDVVFILMVIFFIISEAGSKNQEVRFNSLLVSPLFKGDASDLLPLTKGETQRGSVFLCFCVFVFLCFLSIFWSPDKLIALYWSIRILQGAVLVWLLRKINFSPAKAALVFVASMSLSALLGIYQFVAQSSFASKWLGLAYHSANNLGDSVVAVAGIRWLRAYGALPHPNISAGFLMVAIILCWELIDSQNHKITESTKSQKAQKIQKNNTYKILNPSWSPPYLRGMWRGLPITSYFLLFSCYLLLVIGLFFTFSRAAWLVLCVILLAYTFIFLKQRDWLPIFFNYSKNQEFQNNGKKNELLQGSTLNQNVKHDGAKFNFEPTTIPVFSSLTKWETSSYITKGEIKRGFYPSLLFFSLLIFFVLSFIYWPLVKTRILANERLEMKSNTERIASYQDSYKIIKNSWLTGVGIGNYTQELQKIYPGQPAWFYQPVHNAYLLVLSELGIAGFALLSLLFICLFVLCIKYYVLRNKNLAIKGGQSSVFCFLLIAICFLFFFDHYFWTLASGMLLWWLVLGLVLKVKWSDSLSSR